MRFAAILILALPMVLGSSGLVAAPDAMTLREAYERAGPAFGYDKYVELETGEIYSGGLLIGPVFSPISWRLEGEAGGDVCIVGNGAIIDLQGSQLCISYCNNLLDIADCVIINGNIRYRGMDNSDYSVLPQGSVRQVTFYGADDYGVRLTGTGAGITLERNLVVNAIDTGYDFIYTHGASLEWLPTGANICFSIQFGFYGVPTICENWSYHTDALANADPLRHFLMLCEYG